MVRKNILLIVILLVVSSCFSQEKGSTRFFSKNYADGLCSYSVTLYPDSTFFKESGCEGNSRIHFGKYEENKDSIILNPLDDILYWFGWEIKKAKSNDSIKVQIIDSESNPLKDFRFLVYETKDSLINELKNEFKKDFPEEELEFIASDYYRDFNYKMENDDFQLEMGTNTSFDMNLSTNKTDHDGIVRFEIGEKNILEAKEYNF